MWRIGLFGLLLRFMASTRGDQVDEGYENLFITSNQNVPRTCMKSSLKGYGIKGSFFISSIAQFEINEQQFTATLDGFGKYHKFEMSEGEICYTSRMIESELYKQSVTEGKIMPSILFNETIPPRNTSKIMKNILGPNDNLYVNILKIGDDFRSNTDAQFMLSFDPNDLSVKGKVQWTDDLDKGKIYLGSAHPLLDENTKCYYSVDNQANILGTKADNIFMKICPTAPSTRVEINRYDCPYLPYIHSFGLTENYAIVPHQLFSMDFKVLEKGGSLSEAFVSVNQSKMDIFIIPKDGSNVMKFEVDPFYYVHFLNSYETKDSIVFDATTYETNPLLGGLSIEQSKNAQQRNLYNPANAGMVKRFTLHLAGAEKGQLEVITMSKPNTSTDFTTYNHNYATQSYCIYYAIEWWHDQIHMGSMAIVKRNMCNGDVLYWHELDYFPSEPTFIPSVSAADEDDGALVFTALQGKDNSGYYIIVDAKTMKSIDEVLLPTGITFTAHGQYFSDV